MPLSFFETSHPDAEKSFQENYGDHLQWIQKKVEHKYFRFWKLNSHSERLSLILNELALINKADKPLIDEYDYLDELMGATLIPFFSALNTAVFIVAATFECAQALAIQTSQMKDDQDNHLNTAMGYLILAGASLLLTVVSALKACVSLVTRPMLTIWSGYQLNESGRFINYSKNEEDYYASFEYPQNQ
ncbi:Uncharacterised protein (plasmid) [Legionella adelaidensis]|uniref:Uncharacterized protein n=1 Tax=Legionella adelaidensis TaxID=45056 RepID=A0A0W0R1C7_9GAMM|nr:hypothetical protein [Legionella adelaidensis]KTC64798.1 hypothetical protein Lade_2092 [Legionella adelaidensis]VEH86214.1 Uncharacterised protein [Legionella adelaidensis]